VYLDPIENRFVFDVCVAVEPFQPLKLCHSQWSDASMCALIQVEDILSICCENCDVINDKNRMFIKLGTCDFIMSYLRKILLDVYEFVHCDIIINTTNEMQLYRLIYYF
jgi:hypothetical protein